MSEKMNAEVWTTHVCVVEKRVNGSEYDGCVGNELNSRYVSSKSRASTGVALLKEVCKRSCVTIFSLID